MCHGLELDRHTQLWWRQTVKASCFIYHQNQPQFPAHFNNKQPPQSIHHQTRPTSPRFSAPQQGSFRSPSPQQQQQRRPGLFTAHAQRRMGIQQRTTAPLKVNTITTAKWEKKILFRMGQRCSVSILKYGLSVVGCWMFVVFRVFLFFLLFFFRS